MAGVMNNKLVIGVMSVMIFCTGVTLAAEPANNPYLQPDVTWISISGLAIEAEPGSFSLNYGEGAITVKMDNWQWYKKGQASLAGDRVTVYGKIDKNLFSANTLEAASIYVESIGTYFYANNESRKDKTQYTAPDYWITAYLNDGKIKIRGSVKKVRKKEFVIGSGEKRLIINTSSMSYNTLDKSGYQQIEKGDYVSVVGEMNAQFFEKRMVIAKSIISIDRDNTWYPSKGYAF